MVAQRSRYASKSQPLLQRSLKCRYPFSSPSMMMLSSGMSLCTSGCPERCWKSTKAPKYGILLRSMI